MSDDTVELNIKPLEKLLKAFKDKMPTVRVGILGSKDARQTGKASSNATIGAAHEFGTSVLPQRSFLRVPISEHLEKQLEKSGAFDKEALANVIKEGSLVPYMEKIGVAAEAVVAEAFDSNGFGKWQPSNMARKDVKQTLVETGQLRNSITSEVVK